MADKTRKRTPEEMRTIPTKGTGRSGGPKQPRPSKQTTKPGGAANQNKRSTINPSARPQEIPRTSRPMHRVASTREKSVMFTLDAPTGRDVSISGSFNDWTPLAMAKGSDGLWRITIQAAQGTYNYRFLVDSEWREDPNNPRKELNTLGGYDSICDVL